MPLVRVTHPAGAMPRPQKAQVAAELTEIVLEAEVDAVTEPGRMVTVVQFIEAKAEDWSVGGRLRSETESPPDHYVVEVLVLEGLLEGERRASVHRRIGEAFRRAFPADPMLPLRVWILIHEVREGSWGVAGYPVSALDVAAFIHPDLAPELRDQIAAALAARRR